LPPGSFKNIEVSFCPTIERAVQVQTNLTVRYNTQPLQLTMNGSGIQLKLVFDPPELLLPTLYSFSEPSTRDVKVINPTNYPLQIIPPQFDHIFHMIVEESQTAQLINNDTVMIDSTASKFAICAIVCCIAGFGTADVSAVISQKMGNIPIIRLSELWKPLLEKPESTPEEFIQTLHDEIQDFKYFDGFVVDSLSAFPEPPDLVVALGHLLKIKTCFKTKTIHNNHSNLHQQTIKSHLS
jgi:hydrocephalus-inducing protein